MTIYQSIAKAMEEIGAVSKQKNDKSNLNYAYRGIDAVMNALNPAMRAAKIFVVPEVLEQTREERQTAKGGLLIYSICKIKFKFYAEDGSFVEAVTVGEGMDSGDKATNKAMSIAFKYACFQVFCIPTEEMVDPDAERHEVSPKQEAKAPEEATTSLSPDQKAAITSELNRTHVVPAQICQRYKINSIDDLPVQYFDKLMKQLKATPTFEEAGEKN